MFLHINKWNETLKQERKLFDKSMKKYPKKHGFKTIEIKHKTSLLPCDYVIINENAIYMVSFLNIQGTSYDYSLNPDLEYYDLFGDYKQLKIKNPYKALSLENDEFISTICKLFNRKVKVGLEIKYIVVHPRRFEDKTWGEGGPDKTKHVRLHSIDYELQYASKMKNLSPNEVTLAYDTIKKWTK